MKTHLGILILFATSAFADTTTRWSGTGKIDFAGSATVHDWAGTVAAKPFTTTVTLDDSGRPKHIEAAVTVEAAGMDTAEPKRDAQMRKAMQVSSYPLITATVDAAGRQIATAGDAPAKLPMTLKLLGKSQQVSGTITKWKRSGNQATFELDFPVSMKASGIAVPPMLFFIRVGDTVNVHASVTLSQLGS